VVAVPDERWNHSGGVVLKLNSLIADANTPDVPYNSKVKQ
jgi:hypothetical protein